MTKREYQKYLKTKNKLIKQILDIYEFKLDYDKNEIIFIYYDLKNKTIKYLVYKYHNLIENL
jgi:hypothetical protein